MAVNKRVQVPASEEYRLPGRSQTSPLLSPAYRLSKSSTWNMDYTLSQIVRSAIQATYIYCPVFQRPSKPQILKKNTSPCQAICEPSKQKTRHLINENADSRTHQLSLHGFYLADIVNFKSKEGRGSVDAFIAAKDSVESFPASLGRGRALCA